jgi:hypothetical protein
MSGTIPRAVILRPRIGPYRDARPKQRFVGSTVSVFFDACDEITDELVPEAIGFGAIYWRPELSDYDSQVAPAPWVQLAPGQWRADVPMEMPGKYTIWGSLQTPAVEAAEIIIFSIGAGA